MDGANEARATRASKRRRVSPPTEPSPRPVRSTSPDELASGPQTPVVLSRQPSTPSIAPQQSHCEPQRPSFSPVSDSSPDELDHTRNVHTFYRNNEIYRPASFGNRAGQNSALAFGGTADPRPPSPPTPEYSRISTPIASPPPESQREEMKEARFTTYTCRSELKGHKGGVAAVRISRDGTMLASCCEFWPCLDS